MLSILNHFEFISMLFYYFVVVVLFFSMFHGNPFGAAYTWMLILFYLFYMHDIAMDISNSDCTRVLNKYQFCELITHLRRFNMVGLAANRLTSAWMPGPHRHELLWVWNRFLFWFSIMVYIAVMFGGYISDIFPTLALDAFFYFTSIIIHIVNIVILRIQPVHPNKKLDWILLIYSFVISVASMCEYLVLGILIRLHKIPKDRAVLRISSHALFTALIIFVVIASKEVRDSCGNVIFWPILKVKAILKKHNGIPETVAVA